MRVRQIQIKNFRGVSEGTVDFSGHSLLVGRNNVGKSTVCEALELVLGPERMYRKPVVDEHDFYKSKYLDGDKNPIEIQVHVVLSDLSDEQQRRFINHLRCWNEKNQSFVDPNAGDDSTCDGEGLIWVLPLVFIGRYDHEEDDFIGNTFFDHPVNQSNTTNQAIELRVGQGRSLFGRDQKRLCGFIYLRALRTGARALSLERGSLLDTVLRLEGSGMSEMWDDILTQLRDISPPIGDQPKLKLVREELEARIRQFVTLAQSPDEASAFFASDLTRESLRNVIRLFIAAQPGPHLLPFRYLGTGSINVLVFALLTYIAAQKGPQSVIFAMEEPEIALPPHVQRRVAKFLQSEMGQVLLTSHSPYVIEQFAPSQITLLDRRDDGSLTGRSIDLKQVQPKEFRRRRRQLGEAVLGRAVLVVEGITEEMLFPAAAEVLERGPREAYTGFDLAGVTIFDAEGDGNIPTFGPFFSAMGKQAYAFHDARTPPYDSRQKVMLAGYNKVWELPNATVEEYCVMSMPIGVVRRFLSAAMVRSDYPTGNIKDVASMLDQDVRQLATDVAILRKPQGYVALLISQCDDPSELPPIIKEVLEAIDSDLA